MKKNKKVSLNKKPFLVLSRRATAGWACAAFFICAWMFFIGILVGRGTAPLKFEIAGAQKKLEAARQALNDKEQLRAQGKSGIAKDKTKLDFYEALKNNREDTQINKKKPAASADEKTASLPAKKPPVKRKGKAEKSIIEKDIKKKARPTKSSNKKPVVTKSKVRPSGQTFTIQVASVKSVQDADRLVVKLKKKGFHARRVIGKVPGKGIWYRVRIGEFKSRAAARNTLDKLKRAGLKPIVLAN